MDILQKALEDENLDYNCKGVISYLALVAENNQSYTSELVRESGSSDGVVKRSFARLENAGYVKRLPPQRIGSKRRVVYKLATVSENGQKV